MDYVFVVQGLLLKVSGWTDTTLRSFVARFFLLCWRDNNNWTYWLLCPRREESERHHSRNVGLWQGLNYFCTYHASASAIRTYVIQRAAERVPMKKVGGGWFLTQLNNLMSVSVNTGWQCQGDLYWYLARATHDPLFFLHKETFLLHSFLVLKLFM